MKTSKNIRQKKINPMQCVEYKGMIIRKLTYDRLERLRKLHGGVNIEQCLRILYRKMDLRTIADEAGVSVFTIHKLMHTFKLGRRKQGPIKQGD